MAHSTDLLINSNDIATQKLQNAIHHILLLRLNQTEVACLKTLILFRPGKRKWAELLYLVMHAYILNAISFVA